MLFTSLIKIILVMHNTFKKSLINAVKSVFLVVCLTLERVSVMLCCKCEEISLFSG